MEALQRMIVPFFDLGTHVASKRMELHSLLDAAIDSGQFVGGSLLKQFELDFSRYVGADHAVGVGNGLDALRMVLEGWGIGPGDEVIVPGFSFYATWLAVMQVGATPVFVDVEYDTANLDAAGLLEAYSSKTRAIIVVHLYGRPANMLDILDFTTSRGIRVLEDCAQAHGATFNGKLIGSIGDAAAFSFYPTKNLGALGDGGAVATRDEALARFIRSRGSYGVGRSKYEHVDFGWNSRLDSLQASFLGLGLVHLGETNATRVRIAQKYREALGENSSCVVGPSNAQDSVWHHFVLRCNDRELVRMLLSGAGIATDIHYPYHALSVPPVEQYVNEKNALGVELPVSKRLSREVLSLPIGPWMSEAQIERVAEALTSLPAEILVTST